MPVGHESAIRTSLLIAGVGFAVWGGGLLYASIRIALRTSLGGPGGYIWGEIASGVGVLIVGVAILVLGARWR
jgi:hypothetical protein